MDITELLSSLQDATNVFTAQDVILVILLSFVLSLAIGWVYQFTYQGVRQKVAGSSGRGMVVPPYPHLGRIRQVADRDNVRISVVIKIG